MLCFYRDMNLPLQPTRLTKFRFYVLAPIVLATFLLHATSDIAHIRRQFENYYNAKHNLGVEAQIVTSSLDLNPVIGVVHFRYNDGTGPKECSVRLVLGKQSNYLKYKAGNLISVVPMDGCQNTIVATDVSLPIFDILMLAILTIFAISLLSTMIKFFRQSSVVGTPASG